MNRSIKLVLTCSVLLFATFLTSCDGLLAKGEFSVDPTVIVDKSQNNSINNNNSNNNNNNNNQTIINNYYGVQQQSSINESNQNVNSNVRELTTEFGRDQRFVGGEFLDRKTDYNVFAYEVENCCRIEFNYSATMTGALPCTGTRDVYVRDRNSEKYDDDDGWRYLGSFEYKVDGKKVPVNIKIDPARNVYAVAVVRQEREEGCSFSANWGNSVKFSYLG